MPASSAAVHASVANMRNQDDQPKIPVDATASLMGVINKVAPDLTDPEVRRDTHSDSCDGA